MKESSLEPLRCHIGYLKHSPSIFHDFASFSNKGIQIHVSLIVYISVRSVYINLEISLANRSATQRDRKQWILVGPKCKILCLGIFAKMSTIQKRLCLHMQQRKGWCNYESSQSKNSHASPLDTLVWTLSSRSTSSLTLIPTGRSSSQCLISRKYPPSGVGLTQNCSQLR